MNASIQTHRALSTRQTLCSAPIAPKYLEIGNGFTALSFKHASFDEIMDPLIIVDHFRMSKPTFGAHGHAGISAVSVLFEDSEGAFNSRDSLGNNIDLKPGDLYWLKAGKGAMHDEKPLPGARTHGLQMFVNLPASQKHEAPEAVHVKAGAMPIIKSATHRVRVVLGESNGVRGATSPALPLSILDAELPAGGLYTHLLPAGQSAWIHPIKGDANIRVEGESVALGGKEALVIQAGRNGARVTLASDDRAQLALIAGAPIGEKFIQRGPFAMANEADLDAAEAAYQRGEFGSID